MKPLTTTPERIRFVEEQILSLAERMNGADDTFREQILAPYQDLLAELRLEKETGLEEPAGEEEAS